MINIDGVYYYGNLKKSKVEINGEWKNILILDIDIDLENIDIIKYQNKVYKIDKVINRFKDNKKWLIFSQESPDLEKQKIEEIESTFKNQIKELNKEMESLKSVNKANMLALMEVNSKLLDLEVDK